LFVQERDATEEAAPDADASPDGEARPGAAKEARIVDCGEGGSVETQFSPARKVRTRPVHHQAPVLYHRNK
jgi:hypothetical protein